MNIQLGDIITGEISGIKPYGLFIKTNNQVTFCHISNVSKSFTANLSNFKMGQIVQAKVIQFVDDKINVSIKDVDSEIQSDNSKFIQKSIKHKVNINNSIDKKESFDDMLKHYLKNSDDKLKSIAKRTKKHTKR